MAKFKVGDRVVFIEDYGTSKKGDVGIIEGIDVKPPVSGTILYTLTTLKGTNAICFGERLALVWTPEAGERIYVNDQVKNPTIGDSAHGPYFFVAMDGELFVARDCDDDYDGWKYAAPVSKTHTITFEDGRTAEISAESYEAMRNPKEAQK